MSELIGPGQMFDHFLFPLKGWFHEHALDIQGTIDSTIDQTCRPVYAGRVVHVSAQGVVKQGVATPVFRPGATNNQVPIILFKGENTFDVANPGPGGTSPYQWYNTLPAGVLGGLVCLGPYEVQTTEFNTSGTYAMNNLLHAPTVEQITSGSDYSAAGKLYNTRSWPGGNSGAITYGTDNVCGIVSRGVFQNAYRTSVLTFWTWFQPGTES